MTKTKEIITRGHGFRNRLVYLEMKKKYIYGMNEKDTRYTKRWKLTEKSKEAFLNEDWSYFEENEPEWLKI